MAALGNVLLAWFNACLSWKVVWQSDSDLLDGSDGGVLLHQTRGTDPAVINDCATLLWRRKGPSKQIHPWLSTHLTHSLINTASSCNQYLLCWLIVTKKSLQGEKKMQWAYNEGAKILWRYILYEQGAGCLSWRWIMVTWHRWHIGFIHYFTYNSPFSSFTRILSPL